jgi:hypothetical protein
VALRVAQVTFSVLALTLITAPSLAQVPSVQRLHELLQQAVEEAGRREQILVDPRILEEMTASAVMFVGNMCNPPDAPSGIEACDRTVNQRSVLNEIVISYFQEIYIERPAQVMSLAARLAAVIELTMDRAGWPSHVTNNAAVVELPEALRGSRVSMRTAFGLVPLGVAGRIILMAPGQAELVVMRAGESPTFFRLSLAPRSVTPLSARRAAVASVEFSGRVDVPTTLFCHDRGRPQRFEGAAAIFNWGRDRFGEPEETRLAHLASFVQQAGIDIRIVDETGRSCGADCQAGLGAAFAQAISAWRAGCERCSDDAFSVIRVGSTVWIDERLAMRLRHRAAGAQVPLDLAIGVVDERERFVPAPSPLVPTKVIVSYEIASDDAQVQGSVCSLPGNAAPWVRSAQALMCPGSPWAPSGLRPTVRVIEGPTSCGSASRFIACGRAGGDIEITITGYQYMIPTPRGPVMVPPSSSNPRIAINLAHVMLHEVGHWFGVPHPEEVGLDGTADIMGATLGDGPACLSAQAMLLINSAADLRWQYRATAGGGLRPARNAPCQADAEAP